MCLRAGSQDYNRHDVLEIGLNDHDGKRVRSKPGCWTTTRPTMHVSGCPMPPTDIAWPR